MSIKHHLKLLAYNFVYAILGLVFIVGAFIGTFAFFWGDTANSCGEDSEAVTFARSLSQERLKKLYYDMERDSQENDLLSLDFIEEGEELPGRYSDIRALRIRPWEANIMLEGCFDHYVVLDFKGFEKSSSWQKERKIILSWGEHPPHAGSEILWSEG